MIVRCSVAVSIAIGIAGAAWGQTAKKPAVGQQSPIEASASGEVKAAASADAKTVAATAKAGPYRLTIEAQRFVAADEIRIGADRTIMMRGMKMRTGGEKFEDEDEGEHGGGGFGGATGFAAGGGGAAGRFDMPNLQITLRVEAPKSARKKQIVEIDAQYGLTDDLGNEVRPETIAGMTFKTADEEGPEGALRYLYVALPNPQAGALKELEGSLRVEEGELHVVELAAKDLRRAVSKTLGEMNVKIGPLKKVKDGWELPVATPAAKAEPGAMRDPFAAAQAMMKASLNEAVSATLTDSEGAAHEATSSAAGGSGSSFSFGTGSFGTGSSGTSRFESGGLGDFGRKPTRPDRRKPRATDAEPQKVDTLTFPALADGTTPESVTVTIVRRTGEGETFPFKFTDVLLPSR